MKGKKQKRFMSVIFVAFAFIVSLTLTAEGEDLIVPSEKYPHIQAAIYAASYGDTVRVRAGTYSLSENGQIFPIYMKNGVSLIGAGADDCILDAAGQTKKVIECSFGIDSSTRIEGFTITNGSGMYGAGIFFSWGASPTIANNIITGNSADKGGGIYCVFYSYPPIINNVITGNSATINGGGIYFDASFSTITNNTITGNSASWGGGGIYCKSPYPTITNNIITGNTSDSGGGGIHFYNSTLLPITYDDVWGNLRGDIHENYWNCVAGTGSISVDPLFVNPTAGDYHLRADSPCIDKGDPLASELPDLDFDGNDRSVDGKDDGKAIVDMGAFEYQGVLAIDATIDIDPDTLNLKSKGKWITAYIELPEGYDVADIDVSSLLLILKDPKYPQDPEYPVPAESKPASIGDDDGGGILDLMVKFDRAAVERQLNVGDEVEITVSGSLINGTEFVGIDTIRVISKGKK